MKEKNTEAAEVVHIVAACNDFYIPYAATMIQSVIEHSSKSHQYKIHILHIDVTDNSIKQFTEMVERAGNFSIDFINVADDMADYMNLFISNHIKIETYFRLLIPNLLPDVSKTLYIDCDVIANADVYDLYSTDLEDNYLAGTWDADNAANYNTDPEKKAYIDNVIKLTQPYYYMQAGVILMNLDKFRESCPTEKMLATAMSRSWTFHDQDTLNYLCKGHIKFVDYAWNFVYDYNESFRRSTNVIVNAPHYIMSAYMQAKKAPKIIHYSWVDKPWFSPGVHFGEKFWITARHTPFYIEILRRAEADLGKYILTH